MKRRLVLLLAALVLLAAAGCASTKQASKPPEKPEKYYYDALAEINHGKYDKAEAYLNKAIELKPDSYNARLMLGKVIEKQAAPDRAVEAYREAIKLDPADPRGYLGAMNALLDLHRPAEAAALGETGISAGAPKASLLVMTGWSYYEAGEFDKAEHCYRSDLEISEADTSAMNNLGILLFAKGKYIDALSMFKLAHDKNPDSAMSPYLLALTYNRLGKETEALASLKVAVAKNPGLETEFKAYNKAYFMHGDPGDMSGLFARLKDQK